MYRKLTHQLGHPTYGPTRQVNVPAGVPDEVIIELVVDDGSEPESGVEAVIVDDSEGGAVAEDFVLDAVIVDGQGVDEDLEVEFDFEEAEGRGAGANVVVGVENVPPANLVIPSAPAGNGRPRRAGLSVRNYNENNHDLEVEIGVESPIVRKSGSKRRRQL